MTETKWQFFHATKMSNRTRQLNRFIELNHLSARLDPQAVLQSIVDIAAELTQSDYCSILIYDPIQKHLKFAAGPWLQISALANQIIPVEGSIAGESLQTKRVLSLTNANQDPRVYHTVEKTLGIITHNLLSVPIIYREQALGVIQAVNKKEGTQYNHEDTGLLMSLAAHTAGILYLQQLENDKFHIQESLNDLEKRKSEFIAITSHELRTPLGVILGNATFARELLPTKDLKPQLDAIVLSALRLKEIVESLSRSDNLDTGNARLHISNVDLNQLLEDMITAYQSEARRKSIQLIIKIPREPVEVEGEAEKIAVIMQNLLRNALSFTDTNGSIHVSLQKIPGYAQITVSDTGIGIPESELDLIFDRFYQVASHMTRKHGGMGLGLSVAKSMVELHNGQIWVKSEPKKGSVFSFVLPTKQPVKVSDKNRLA
jgi:signal transduction histidine kinase